MLFFVLQKARNNSIKTGYAVSKSVYVFRLCMTLMEEGHCALIACDLGSLGVEQKWGRTCAVPVDTWLLRYKLQFSTKDKVVLG